MNSKLSRKRNSRKQKGGCGLKPLAPAPLAMGPLTGGKKRKSNKLNKLNKSKKGGMVKKLAAVGLLGTLLAFGSKKRKSKGKRTRRRRSTKKK